MHHCRVTTVGLDVRERSIFVGFECTVIENDDDNSGNEEADDRRHNLPRAAPVLLLNYDEDTSASETTEPFRLAASEVHSVTSEPELTVGVARFDLPFEVMVHLANHSTRDAPDVDRSDAESEISSRGNGCPLRFRYNDDEHFTRQL